MSRIPADGEQVTARFRAAAEPGVPVSVPVSAPVSAPTQREEAVMDPAGWIISIIAVLVAVAIALGIELRGRRRR